jgi:predicted ester cyclase
MIERNKEIARYISQKVVNEKNYAPIEEYLTDNYVYHGLGGMTAQTPMGFMEAIKGFHSAIPDLQSEIIDIVGEGLTACKR